MENRQPDMQNGPRTGTAKKRRALWRGKFAEILAALYLRGKFYRILARNFKVKSGEIDIIAKKGNLIAFVEVKARDNVATAINAVSYDNQRRVQNAADYWLTRQKNATHLSMRFDIIAICPWRWPQHFINAF